MQQLRGALTLHTKMPGLQNGNGNISVNATAASTPPRAINGIVKPACVTCLSCCLCLDLSLSHAAARARSAELRQTEGSSGAQVSTSDRPRRASQPDQLLMASAVQLCRPLSFAPGSLSLSVWFRGSGQRAGLVRRDCHSGRQGVPQKSLCWRSAALGRATSLKIGIGSCRSV